MHLCSICVCVYSFRHTSSIPLSPRVYTYTCIPLCAWHTGQRYKKKTTTHNWFRSMAHYNVAKVYVLARALGEETISHFSAFFLLHIYLVWSIQSVYMQIHTHTHTYVADTLLWIGAFRCAFQRGWFIGAKIASPLGLIWIVESHCDKIAYSIIHV